MKTKQLKQKIFKSMGIYDFFANCILNIPENWHWSTTKYINRILSRQILWQRK